MSSKKINHFDTIPPTDEQTSRCLKGTQKKQIKIDAKNSVKLIQNIFKPYLDYRGSSL